MKANLLLEFFQDISRDFPSSGIFSKDGECYFLRYELGGDLGTMGVAVQSVGKYLQLKKGDIALMNDPYSGGTLLSQMTLVTPLPSQQGVELLLLIRTGFKQVLSLAQNIEEEGLRIPPMPIAENFKLNTDLIAAMEAHPLCPSGFRARLETLSKKLESLLSRVDKLVAHEPAWYSKTTLKNYLELSEKHLLNALSELPNGEVELETHLDQGEVLHLKLDLKETGLAVDFGGTSPSKRVCLTDSATFGAVISALLAYINKPIPLNSALFHLIEVSAPLGCFLNAKYPSPTYKGMTDGVAFVAATVLRALSNLSKNKEVAGSSAANAKIELRFEDGKRFFDFTSGGTGASQDGPGVCGASFWIRNHLETSIEEIERLYPLLIKGIHIRENSGGKGQYAGGDGLIKTYELRAPATFTWSIDQTKSQPEGRRQGKSGHCAEILVQVEGQKEKRKMASSEGAMNLLAGDKIFVASSGGAGWGPAQD